jgi:hypothetical protein
VGLVVVDREPDGGEGELQPPGMGESSVGIPVVMVRWGAGEELEDGADLKISF